jgi:hypothetical protein
MNATGSSSHTQLLVPQVIINLLVSNALVLFAHVVSQRRPHRGPDRWSCAAFPLASPSHSTYRVASLNNYDLLGIGGLRGSRSHERYKVSRVANRQQRFRRRIPLSFRPCRTTLVNRFRNRFEKGKNNPGLTMLFQKRRTKSVDLENARRVLPSPQPVPKSPRL